jgi:hypothetical protein
MCDSPARRSTREEATTAKAARILAAAGIARDTGRFRVELGGACVVSPDPAVTDAPLTDPPAKGRVWPDPTLPRDNARYYSPFSGGRYSTSCLVASAVLTATW